MRARLSVAGSLGAGTLWYQAAMAAFYHEGLVRFVSVEPEEGLQGGEDAVAFLLDPLLALVRVEAFAHRGELDPPPRHDAGDALHDLRAHLEDALERFLVETVALHLGCRDHGGAARLAGDDAHLAEDVGRVEPRDDLLHPVVGADAYLDLALGEHVEPVRGGVLAGEDLAS